VLSPYIPSPLDHPRNAGAITVLNSVGLSGVRGIEDPARREALVALLRGQTFIAVRDRGSSRLLERLGIEHALAPDVVHALGVLWPAERDPDAGVAVVQISSAILRTLGHAAVVALGDLDAAIAAAEAAGRRPEVAARSAAQARDAHDHLEDLAARVLRLAAIDTAAARAARADARRMDRHAAVAA